MYQAALLTRESYFWPGQPNHGSDAGEHALVLIVDDDAAVRSAIEELMLSVGIDAIGFGSGPLVGERDQRDPIASELELMCTHEVR